MPIGKLSVDWDDYFRTVINLLNIATVLTFIFRPDVTCLKCSCTLLPSGQLTLLLLMWLFVI